MVKENPETPCKDCEAWRRWHEDKISVTDKEILNNWPAQLKELIRLRVKQAAEMNIGERRQIFQDLLKAIKEGGEAS